MTKLELAFLRAARDLIGDQSEVSQLWQDAEYAIANWNRAKLHMACDVCNDQLCCDCEECAYPSDCRLTN